MQAQHLSSSDSKANTLTNIDAQSTRHLMAVRIVGTALFEYQVRKTDDALIRLECLTGFAKELGDIDAAECAVVAQLLAGHSSTKQDTTVQAFTLVGATL
ncbi:hypothetical protein [Pseudomonas sp. B21-053]|uniref:hypothetical protein n=1 Tax=Pseudomonas sp. B21-053 TaxID=2895493 RepID=UPI002232BE7D|nr:hypothetical protein [Pseudomonas sp. B21-053]UZE13976.1 hypothetical protein LOY68_10285 [Pseudomonas sp. B21-053]